MSTIINKKQTKKKKEETDHSGRRRVAFSRSVPEASSEIIIK